LTAALGYRRWGSRKYLLGVLFWGLCACFTKETALAALPVVVLWVMVYGEGPKRKALALVPALSLCAAIWWLAGHFAAGRPSVAVDKTMLVGVAGQLPALVQYYGKCVVPNGLCPYPTLHDGAFWPGIVAIGITALYFAKADRAGRKRMALGLAVFFWLLLPAFAVPKSDGASPLFEHRLYVPLALLLPTICDMVRSLGLRRRFTATLVVLVAVLFLAMGWGYGREFSSPKSFWEAAYAGSPHSATTNMMLGMETADGLRKGNLLRAALFLSPKHRYINLRYGAYLLGQGKPDSARMYVEREVGITGAEECEFVLAQIALYSGDTAAAAGHLANFVGKGGTPLHPTRLDRPTMVMILSENDWNLKKNLLQELHAFH
jgi:hypothetical protein